MFGATAAIESQNVVGYQTITLKVGVWNCLCGTFLPVDGKVGEVKLGAITANEAFAFGSDTVQTLGPSGGTLGLYTYCGAAEAKQYGITPGWYDYAYINDEWDWESQPPTCDAVPLPYGTMVVVQTGNKGATLTFRGTVPAADQAFTLLTGEWNMLGNATPVDRKLGDFTANEAFAFGTDTVQTLGPSGGTLGLYTYCGAAEAKQYGITPGWYDYAYINDEWDWESQPKTYNGVDLPAGSGFIVQAGSEGAQIVVPSSL